MPVAGRRFCDGVLTQPALELTGFEKDQTSTQRLHTGGVWVLGVKSYALDGYMFIISASTLKTLWSTRYPKINERYRKSPNGALN